MTDMPPAAAPIAPEPNPVEAPFNILAIVGFVLAFVFALAGAIIGMIALGQIRKTGDRGHGLAVAAIAIGWTLVGLQVIGGLSVFSIAITR